MSSLLTEIDRTLNPTARKVIVDEQQYLEVLGEFKQFIGPNFNWNQKDKNLVKAVYQAADAINAIYKKDRVIACQAGCSACCYQLVNCTETEMSLIADLILERPKPIRKKIRTNSKTRIEEFSYLLLKENEIIKDLAKGSEKLIGLHQGKPCMYLDDFAKCLIYEARPIVCRTWRSRQICKNEEDIAGVIKLYVDQAALDLVIEIDKLSHGLLRPPLPIWPLTEKFESVF